MNPNKAKVAAFYGRMAREYGTAGRDRWFHANRRRELETIVGFLAVSPGEDILDAGCGSGLLARRLSGAGARVWGVDLSPQMLAVAAPSLYRAIESDFEDLDLGRSFDAVVCSGALEFTSRPEAAFSRLARSVRPGGRLVVLGPRQSFGGVCYKMIQSARGISVHLFATSDLDSWASAEGMVPAKGGRPFLHNFVRAYHKVAVPTSAVPA